MATVASNVKPQEVVSNSPKRVAMHGGRLTFDEWRALLHQTPPVAPAEPGQELTEEQLRCENLYEDRC